MYDIYLNGSTFATGSTKFPKHKGVLAITNLAQNGLTGHLVNQQGNTISVPFYLPAGPTILPHQFYCITALNTGVTAFLLN
jgi:hypothetical protein